MGGGTSGLWELMTRFLDKKDDPAALDLFLRENK